MINSEEAPLRATIAWLTPPGVAPEARIHHTAAAAGYALLEQPSPGDAQRIDVAVADLRGLLDPAAGAADIIARARALAPTSGFIIAAPANADLETRKQLRRHGDVCFVGIDAAPVIAALRERMRLSGLADEMGERIKSLVADGRTISFSGLRDASHRLSVLVAGKPSPLTLNACNAVKDVASNVSCVFSAGQVMRALEHSRFDCAILHPSGETDLLIALARALRRHRDHRRLSVFLTSEDDDLLDRCAVRDGFETVLAHHLESDLASRLELTARRARMATAMRDFLRSPQGHGGKGDAAGARFFAHHAVRVFKRADDLCMPVSVVGLALQPRSATAGDLSQSLGDALRTATKLVRAEDLLVKLSPTTIAVMARGADASNAAAIAERLEGVISGTLMRSTLEVAKVSAVGVARTPGDGIETVIANVMRKLRIGVENKIVAS